MRHPVSKESKGSNPFPCIFNYFLTYIFYTHFSSHFNMKYYNEEKMQNLRLKLEKEILNWPNVTTKKMYGCPCFKNKEKLFAFLVTDGIVLTKVSEQDKMKLSKEFNIKPFQAATRTMKSWPQIPFNDSSVLEKIIPFIENSYNQSKN